MSFFAGKRSYCIPFMYHMTKSLPMECNSDMFWEGKGETIQSLKSGGERNKNSPNTQMMGKDCTYEWCQEMLIYIVPWNTPKKSKELVKGRRNHGRNRGFGKKGKIMDQYHRKWKEQRKKI